MALLPPRKGSTKRRPGTKGVIQGDIVRGVERTRIWPKKRGPSKTQQQKEQTEKFRQAQWAFKYQDAAVIDTINDMVAETPLMPRDLFLMMASGRAFAFDHGEEGVQYSMAAQQDVSESLDVISNVPGYMLLRGAQFWEGQPVPGGLSSFGWTVVNDKTITSPIAVWDVSIAGFNDLMMVVLGVTASISGFRAIRVSTDGGASFFSTSGNYTWWNTDGVSSNATEIFCYGVSGSTAARNEMIQAFDLGSTISPKLWRPTNYTNRPIQMFGANTLPINAVRYFNTGGGNMTGGRLLTLGR